MTNIYPATLENGIVTWGPNGAPPLPLDEKRDVEVFVRESPKSEMNNKQLRRQLLQELARLNTFAAIEDPVEYIREIRKDRPLEGRDE